MRKFTPEEDKFLLGNYTITPAKRMSKILGRSESTARQRMKLLGIIVPPEIVAKFKADSQIKKGSISHNLGRKQVDYMTTSAIEKTKATRFKKGQLPHNTKADLEITTRLDNRGIPYRFIRINLATWIPFHRYTWEQSNGKIPSKMKLIFKDGNTMNCSIENLELLTPGDLMKRNSYHNLPKPLANLVQLRGALNKKINKRIKDLENEK